MRYWAIPDADLLSRPALDHLLAQNFRTVIWNNLPEDWRDPDGWAERRRHSHAGWQDGPSKGYIAD